MFRTLYTFCMAKTADWPMSGERADNDSISPECRRRGNVITLFPDRGDRYISKGHFPVGE